ncbi:glutamate decarboxylase isozyme, partial [Escherichia coli]
IIQIVIFVLQFILRHAIFFLSQSRFGCTYVIHKYP